MAEARPPGATDEERSLRFFKDALMKRAPAAIGGSLLFPESKEELRRAQKGGPGAREIFADSPGAGAMLAGYGGTRR